MSDSQPLLRSNSESASPSFAQLVSDAVPDAIEIPAIHVAKATHSFISEFYKFIARGSVVDLTIGIVIGGAFGDVAKSLVDDVLSPFVGLVTGNALANEFILLKPGHTPDAVYNTPQQAVDDGALPLNYGAFLETTVKFFLIGLFLFLLLKIYSVITQATLIAEEELKRIEEEEKRKNERECPFCLERCRKEAKVCKWCTREIPAAK